MTFKTGALIALLSLIPLSLTLTLRDSSCPSGKNYGSDSNLYWDLAQNLVHRHAFVFSPGSNYPGVGVRSQSTELIDNLCVLPGYPLLLVPFIRFGILVGPYVLAYLLYVLLSLFVFASAAALFQTTLSSRALWGWFLLYQILNPTWIVQLRALGQDLAAATLLAFFVWVLIRCRQSQRVTGRNLFGMALGSAAAVGIRTNLLAFIVPVLFFLAVLYWRTQRPRLIALPVAGLVVALSLMGLWGLHIQHLTGRFSLGSNMGYCTYVNYVSRHVPPSIVDAQMNSITHDFDAELAQTQNVNQASMHAAAVYQHVTLDFIAAHPLSALKSTAQNMAATFIGRDYFWLPRLWLLRLRHKPLETYADLSYHDQIEGMSKGAAAAALVFQLLVFGIYLLLPTAALIAAVFFATKNPLLRGLSGGAIIFLVATGLIIGQARYRMPVQVIMYLCTLWVWSRSTAGPDAA